MYRPYPASRRPCGYALLITAALLGACATRPDTPGQASQLAQPVAGPVPGAAASATILATRAWVSAEGGLQIEYLDAQQAVTVNAALPRAESLQPDGAGSSQAGPRPPVVAFSSGPSDLPAAPTEAVAIRSPQAWQELVHRLQREVAAQVPERGIVLDVLRQEEIFLYVDAQGELVAVPIADKPGHLEPAGVVTLTELLSKAAERVRLALQLEGVNSRYLLFNTGDLPDTGFPFVLLDLAERRVFFIQRQPDTPRLEVHGPALAAQAAFHAITSQVRSLTARPLSSFTRLLFSVGSTAVDTLWLPPVLSAGGGPVPPLAAGPPMDAVAWEAELDEVGGVGTHGRVDYLVDGDAFFPALIHAIGQARQSIRMRLYIFDNDDYAIKIADILKARSREVDVQILLDGFGTIAGGLAQAEYTPQHARRGPASIVAYLQADSDIQVRTIANPWMQGDHTKVIIIDDRTAFLGGMNIGREYRYEWHDLMAQVSGPVVDVLIRDFIAAWAHEGPFGDLQTAFGRVSHPLRDPAAGDYPLRLLYTRPTDSQILRSQIRAMRRAQQRVWLQNAYLTSDAILSELLAARRRGVDVRVILPYRTDAGLISRSNVLAANLLLRNGIRVFIYPGMSHVKAAIYDGWACLGSANFDQLSLRLNLETNIATSHPAAVQRLADTVFLPDFSRAVELTEPLPASWFDYLTELIADHL